MSLSVPLNLTQTQGHYTFTVPSHGYQNVVAIDVAGAGGGSGGLYYGSPGVGGNGARITGNFTVSPGDVIDVYIGDGGKQGGGAASNYNSGGAGGYGATIGDTYGSGTLYPVTLSWAWSGFMNTYAVWVNPDEVNPVGQLITVTRIINVPVGQNYQFEVQADNHIVIYVDNQYVTTTDSFQGSTYASVYLNPGQHTIRMDVENYGGPAGFAVTLTGQDDGVQYWNTRSNLSSNSYRYNFVGGSGGYTQGDGGYVYPGPGGGGGATSIFLNGNLILVAGGGGGGGAEGGHGAGGGAGRDGGSSGGGSPEGNKGQDGSGGYDVAGTPGGGGGYNGGSAGGFVYYDDAPSTGANGGTNYNALNLTYTSGSGVYTVPNGVTQLTVTVVGGGGGGAGASGNEEPVYTGGGGGGGYSNSIVMTVSPGQQIPWTVGAGGSGGAVGGTGSTGGTTSFGSLSAAGGGGGSAPGGGAPNGSSGVYVDDGGDGWDQPGAAGGYPNGGAGGSYSEGGEYGTQGSSGSNGSINIQIGSWSYSTYAGSGRVGDGLPGYCNFTFSRLGAGSVKVNGSWKLISDSFVKVNGNWREVTGVWTKVNDSWKLISTSGTVTPTFTPA